MGLCLACECKKCGYAFEAAVGVGFLYPKTYCETISKVKAGEFGKQGKEFFEAFPDGAISCESIVVQCNDCGKLMTVPDLTLYVPKEGYAPKKQDKSIPWSTAFSGKGYEYVSFTDLQEYYQKFEPYDHRCVNCNGHTSIVTGFTDRIDNTIDRHVHCPKCGEMIEIYFTGYWD